jgi:hypothetical protein
MLAEAYAREQLNFPVSRTNRSETRMADALKRVIAAPVDGSRVFARRLMNLFTDVNFSISRTSFPIGEKGAVENAVRDLSGIYFEKNIASHLPETVEVSWAGESYKVSSEEAARLWTAWKVSQGALVKWQGREIENSGLKAVLDTLNHFLPKAFSGEGDGIVVHAQVPDLSDADLDLLASKFSVNFGLVVSLNARLHLNIFGDEKKASRFEKALLKAAAADQVKLGSGQLTVSASPEGFISLQTFDKKADALLGADGSAFMKIGHQKNIGSRWALDAKAKSDMPTLAASIATVLFAALDEKVDRLKVNSPSDYASGALLTAVLGAIQGYLATQVAA